MKKVFSRNTGYLFEVFGSDFKKERKFKNTEKYEFESQTKTITMALSGALGLKKTSVATTKVVFFQQKKNFGEKKAFHWVLDLTQACRSEDTRV